MIPPISYNQPFVYNNNNNYSTSIVDTVTQGTLAYLSEIEKLKTLTQTTPTDGLNVALHLHMNMEYAEYTEEQIIKNFPPLYRKILDVLDKYPNVKVSWDIETGRSIDLLKNNAPDIINRIKKGIEEGRYEVQNVVDPFSLGATLEKEDFVNQILTARKKLNSTFGKTASGYFAQESSFSPELIDVLKDQVGFIFIRKLQLENSSEKNFTQVKGKEGQIPAVVFEGFEIERPDSGAFLKELSRKGKNTLVTFADDAEVFDPKRLDRVLKQWGEIPGVKFTLPSIYAATQEPDGISKIEDTTWIYPEYYKFKEHYSENYGVWMWDDTSRNYLKQLEYTRKKCKEAEFINKHFNIGMENEANEAYKLYTIGTNSDHLGWNPSKYKIDRGYSDLNNAITITNKIKNTLSNKILSQNELLIYNPENSSNSLPARVKMEFKKGECFEIELKNSNFDYFANRYEDGSIKNAELFILDELKPESVKKVEFTLLKEPQKRTTTAQTGNPIEVEFSENGLTIKSKDKKRFVNSVINDCNGILTEKPVEIASEKGKLQKIIEKRSFNNGTINAVTTCLKISEKNIIEIDKKFIFPESKNVTIDPFQIRLEKNKLTRENVSTDSTLEFDDSNNPKQILTSSAFSNNGAYFTTRGKFDDIFIQYQKANLFHTEPEVSTGPTVKMFKRFMSLLVTDIGSFVRLAKKYLSFQSSRDNNIKDIIKGERSYHLAVDFKNNKSDNPLRVILPENNKEFNCSEF